MAQSTANPDINCYSQRVLAMRHSHAIVGFGQINPTFCGPHIFWNIPNREPVPALQDCGVPINVAFLEGPHRRSVASSSVHLSLENLLTVIHLAEWAIARLQVEARHTKKAVLPNNEKDSGSHVDRDMKGASPNENNASVEIGKYHCTSQNHHGDLILTAEGVRYVTAVRSNLLWELRYDNVKTIQKSRSGDGVTFVLMDDTEHKVMGLKQRNEVFTQMIGYSGLVWQVTG